MKPGSLVIIEYYDPKILGIILRETVEEFDKSNMLGYDKTQRWWHVLCDDGKTAIEAEDNLKLI